MSHATYGLEVIPGKTSAPVVTLRFPYLPETGEKVKLLGFWWAPAPSQCWYIPERVRAARAKAVMVTSVERLFLSQGLLIRDELGILPAARVVVAVGEANAIGANPSAPPATLAADGAIHRAGVAAQPSALSASQAAVMVAELRVIFAPAPRAVPPQPSRSLRQPVPASQNLNDVVRRRMSEQLREGQTARTAARREAPPVTLVEGIQYLLMDSATIVNNGQTLTLSVADIERVQALLTCPLENSFNQELVELRTKRAAYLDTASRKGCSIQASQKGHLHPQGYSGQLTPKAWGQTDLFPLAVDEEEFFGVDDEFETLSRALGASGAAALNHAGKGCSRCRPMAKRVS